MLFFCTQRDVARSFSLKEVGYLFLTIDSKQAKHLAPHMLCKLEIMA